MQKGVVCCTRSPAFGTSCWMAERLFGGGGGGVVPKGVLNVELGGAKNGTTKGSSTVTPNGPLTPPPAGGESSVKYSAFWQYMGTRVRTTTLGENLGLRS